MDQERKEMGMPDDDIWGISQAMNAEEETPPNAEEMAQLLQDPDYCEAERFLSSGTQETLSPEPFKPSTEDSSSAPEETFLLHMENEPPVPEPLALSMEAEPENAYQSSETAFPPYEEALQVSDVTPPKCEAFAGDMVNESFSEEVLTSATTQFDPLSDAEQLPSLFPKRAEKSYYMESEPETESSAPATVVPRPKRKNRVWRIVGRILLSLLKWTFAIALALAVLAAGLIGYLTVTEYSPAEREKAQTGNQQVSTTYEGNTILRLLTFNIGYGGLGAEADFFMDGGEGVTPESEETVLKNMSGIKRILSDIDADIMFLQEVDTDSKRSYEKNQWRQYEFEFPEYETAFALNYSCDYVPYPIGDFMGKVNSGIATFSRYNIVSATRIALPNSFSWPTRVANLKRCLLVTRLELAGREEQLVLVNCHLEAYDDGEAKRAQTELLLNFIEEEYNKGNYVIVGGDFNQSFPESDAYPLLDKDNWKPGKLSELQRGWRYAYDDSAPTCRLLDRPYDAKTAQYYVIDGFILSPNVQLRRVETVDADFAYTDHNPVVLDISLK